MNRYNNFTTDAITCWDYFNRNGVKFMGSDSELKEKYTGCGHQMPWTDDEACFNEFLCIIDFKQCNKDCKKHKPKLNEDIREFVESLNRSLSK